ncbi:MAG: hypothetical protein JWN68_132 [Nocardioides sp.]|jgi:hypothetical protein|uniref:hypothetical protein n=1 Tax=Nocardioides sp. TaxID=35761 RepID=UPI00261A6A0C|nr:hypothetical protein [Nocardioides sp.]MCW2832179.1 hypothetical protein [Nocardioides sp.]
MNDDLGPKPEPVIEDKEPNPGGADAIPENEFDQNLARDLKPEDNPAVDDELPDEVAAPDDEKSQAPEGDPANAEAGFSDDPDAGEEAEDGSVEPPE